MAAGPLVRAVSEPAVLSGRFFRLSGFFPEAAQEIFFRLAYQAALHDVLPGAFVQLVDGNGGVFGSQPVPDAGVILTILREPSTISQETSFP